MLRKPTWKRDWVWKIFFKVIKSIHFYFLKRHIIFMAYIFKIGAPYMYKHETFASIFHLFWIVEEIKFRVLIGWGVRTKLDMLKVLFDMQTWSAEIINLFIAYFEHVCQSVVLNPRVEFSIHALIQVIFCTQAKKNYCLNLSFHGWYIYPPKRKTKLLSL